MFSIVACYDDYGGPVVSFDSVTKIPTLVGVIGGGDCAKPESPGVHGKVLAIRQWIYQQTGN